MSEWKPRVRPGLRWETLSLDAADGFLLSRIDGTTSVMGLSHLTGLPVAQVQEGLRRLRASGALDADPVGDAAGVTVPTRSPSPVDHRGAPSPLRSPPPSKPAPRPAPAQGAAADDDHDLFDGDDDELVLRAELAALAADDPSVEGDATVEGDAVPADPVRTHDAADDAADARDGDEHKDGDECEGEVAPDLEQSLEGDAETDHADDAEVGDDEEAAALEENNHRKLYETTLRPLPEDERTKLARTATGPTLLALCFDPVPVVIGGIFENPHCGFPHARLVARHHRTTHGLDDVLRRAELARDAQVQRYLLANPMLNDAHLKRVLSPKRLDVIYKVALSRDLPEKNRSKVRLILRSKWSTADGEARAHLVFSTEGRALTLLIGLPFDSQTTTLLCTRAYNSLILIQNLARFASTPPPILQHLMRQPLVKRTPHLRTLIAQHPNCPSDVKRKLREM